MHLVIIFGPLAVGKMTVGAALSRLTGFPLLHGHLTIDLALRFFPYGSPAFQRLNGEFRRRIFEEVAASELPGLIFTFAWSLDDPGDKKYIDGTASLRSSASATRAYALRSWPRASRSAWSATRASSGWPRSGRSASSSVRGAS
jgi:hypothetical protein